MSWCRTLSRAKCAFSSRSSADGLPSRRACSSAARERAFSSERLRTRFSRGSMLKTVSPASGPGKVPDCLNLQESGIAPDSSFKRRPRSREDKHNYFWRGAGYPPPAATVFDPLPRWGGGYPAPRQKSIFSIATRSDDRNRCARVAVLSSCGLLRGQAPEPLRTPRWIEPGTL